MAEEKETTMEDNELEKETNPVDEVTEEATTTDRNETGDKDLTENSETVSNDQEETENENNEVKSLQEKIAQLEKELEQKEDRILRVTAEYDNFRKRTRSEKQSLMEYGSENLAKGLLPALDNFERALQTNVTSEDGKALLQGVEMVYRSILDTFKESGIEPIESVGKEFDPHEHHAVMQGNDEQYESNIVLEELQKGYKLKDRVLRPAMVKVNQ